MDKLYEINNKLAKIWKLGKLQAFMYPAICFGLLASAAVIISIMQYLQTIF